MNKPKRVVLFSPVRLPAATFALTSSTWLAQNSEDLDLSIWIYDDNDDADTSALIQAIPDVRLLPQIKIPGAHPPYVTEGWTHIWTDDLVDHIIAIRNSAIEAFADDDYDYLLLLDSDTCLHPDTIRHLVSLDLPIVSEIIWTRFRPHLPLLPNVWDYHEHEYFGIDSLIRLKTPGVYRVGGLAACTLMSKDAVAQGLSFSRIPGLAFWGEDRHFSTRASALGIPLHVDTTYPAYHLYQPELVNSAREWITSGCKPEVLHSALDHQWEGHIYLHHLLFTRHRRNPFFFLPRILFRLYYSMGNHRFLEGLTYRISRQKEVSHTQL
jgi:hypothetical protein